MYIQLIYMLIGIWGVDCIKTQSVIIVGAGPSGVAAFTRLLENGFENVTILEAENRIGGRVNSIHFGDAYIDMGAEWCHGEKNNIVYEMVKDLNILKSGNYTLDVYLSSGEKLDDNFSSELHGIRESIYTTEGLKRGDGSNLGDYCIRKYNESIYDKFGNDPKKLSIAKKGLRLFHLVVLTSEGALSWFDPSAKSDFQDCEGDLGLTWNGFGFKTVLDLLLKKTQRSLDQLLREGKVQLNKEVQTVDWDVNGNELITVKCSDNTVYTADHIIFTPSVGVLKHEHQKIFEPPLPSIKVKAIEDIGFGGVMKVFLHFAERWWDFGSDRVTFLLWDNDDFSTVAKEFNEGPSLSDQNWVTFSAYIVPVEKNPNVLSVWFAGLLTPEIEKLSNDTITNGVVYILNRFYGNIYNVTRPDFIRRTYWNTNTHFRGTYSYQTLNARRNNGSAELELSKPLINRDGRLVLQFAGEASHPYHYSTVHGAIETGHREAERIIQLYK